MKCDRRWWNDGRLDRVQRAYSEHTYKWPSHVVYGRIIPPMVVDNSEIDEKMAQWMYERIADVFGVR